MQPVVTSSGKTWVAYYHSNSGSFEAVLRARSRRWSAAIAVMSRYERRAPTTVVASRRAVSLGLVAVVVDVVVGHDLLFRCMPGLAGAQDDADVRVAERSSRIHRASSRPAWSDSMTTSSMTTPMSRSAVNASRAAAALWRERRAIGRPSTASPARARRVTSWTSGSPSTIRSFHGGADGARLRARRRWRSGPGRRGAGES